MTNSQRINQSSNQTLSQSPSEELSPKLDLIIANQNDLIANQYLAPLSKSYLPWTKSAMRPSGLVAVLNEITINRRRCIVECGGGISTFYIARLLADKGGHLYTLEHDQAWCELLQQELAKENLAEYVSIIFAPLGINELKLNQVGNDWYESSVLKQQLESLKIEKIDLLIVDGPPAYETDKQLARYPAVPFFSTYLAQDYTIILDDIDRPGEQEVLQAWETQLGINFERRLAQGNIAIGRVNSSLII